MGLGLSFLGRPLGPAFTLRVDTIAPGASRPYVAADWEGRIVVVERGAVEVDCALGGRRTFSSGAVVFLAGLDLRTIRNPDPEPAVLSSVMRRTDESGAPDPSEGT